MPLSSQRNPGLIDHLTAVDRYAYLRIEGQFDPESLTQAFGVVPTKTWRIGDQVSRGVRASGMWQIDSRAPRAERFEDHVLDLLAQVAPASEALRRATVSHEGWIQLVSLNTPSGQANSSFSSKLLSRVTDLGLGMNIEVNARSDEEDKDAD